MAKHLALSCSQLSKRRPMRFLGAIYIQILVKRCTSAHFFDVKWPDYVPQLLNNQARLVYSTVYGKMMPDFVLAPPKRR